MTRHAEVTIPANAPGIAGRSKGGADASPMKQPEPKAVRRMRKRLAARRLGHSAILVGLSKRGSPLPATAFKAPGSQKK